MCRLHFRTKSRVDAEDMRFLDDGADVVTQNLEIGFVDLADRTSASKADVKALRRMRGVAMEQNGCAKTLDMLTPE